MRKVLIGGMGCLSLGCGMTVDSKQEPTGADSAFLTDTASFTEAEDDDADGMDDAGAGSTGGADGWLRLG